MRRYVIGRLAQAVPTLLGALVLLFLALYVLPNDPVQALSGDRAPSPEFRAAFEERYGLDRPLPARFGAYVGRLVRGDLGESVIVRQPVRTIIAETLPVTLRLTAVGVVFLLVIGGIAGVIAGRRRGRPVDLTITLSAVVLASIPVFVTGVLLQVFVALRLPALGLPVEGLHAGFRSYILPGFVLSSVSIAALARVQRASLIEAMGEDHVRTARAKGLRERDVIIRHVWRNSLIPVVTFLGVEAGAMMGGAILTETVFNVPGIGLAMANAIASGDNPVVLGIGVFITGAFLMVNILVDVSYAWLDPRIRYA